MTTTAASTPKWILWLNTAGETVIAIGMFNFPDQFFPGAEGLSASIARAFSFAILAVAFISLTAVVGNRSRETEQNVVNILLFYHFFQLIAQFVNGALYPPMLIPPVVIHTVFTTLFLYYYLRIRKTGATDK